MRAQEVILCNAENFGPKQKQACPNLCFGSKVTRVRCSHFLLYINALFFFFFLQFLSSQLHNSFIHSSSSVSNGVEMMGIVKGLSRNNAHWYGGGGGDSGWSLGQKKRRRPLSLAEQLHGDTRNFFYNKEKGVV